MAHTHFNRSTFALALLAAAQLFLQSCTGTAPVESPSSQRPPNLLLLVAEDLSPRTGFAGDPVAQTPNLDELARASVHFTRAFTTAGVCAPSRAALIMGQHQISFAAQHMRSSTAPLGPYLARPPAELKAFPELLRRAGYFTFTDNKLDYQFSGIRAGSGPFSIWNAEGQNAGWQQRAADQPFFGLINFNQTHESGVMALTGEPLNKTHAATRQWRTAAGLNAPRTTDPAALTLPAYYPDLPAVRKDLARHYDNIAQMDRQVGAVLRKLADDGLADNTIVVWTTDHGDGLPRAKRELFDSGLHVPLLAYFPPATAHLAPADWRPGTTNARLVSFVDLAPTLLALARVKAPELYHGRSIFDRAPRDYVYASRDRIDEVKDRQRAIRSARYKYIRSYVPGIPGGHLLKYRDLLGSARAMRDAFNAGELTPVQARWFEPTPAVQLYDLSTDPEETNNLAGNPAYAAIETRMRTALDAQLAKVRDTGDVDEASLRNTLLDAEGKIRQTDPPKLIRTQGRLEIQAAGNASIEYQVDEQPPRLYVQPLDLRAIAGRTISARAVRYGYLPSDPVTRLVTE